MAGASSIRLLRPGGGLLVRLQTNPTKGVVAAVLTIADGRRNASASTHLLHQEDPEQMLRYRIRIDRKSDLPSL